MQEIKHDDSFDLTDYEDCVAEHGDMNTALAKAFKKMENKAVALHKPGSVVTDKRGTKHEVQKNGSWKRIRGNRG